MMLNSKFRDVIKKLNYYLVRLHEGNGGLDWGGGTVSRRERIFVIFKHFGRNQKRWVKWVYLKKSDFRTNFG